MPVGDPPDSVSLTSIPLVPSIVTLPLASVSKLPFKSKSPPACGLVSSSTLLIDSASTASEKSTATLWLLALPKKN